MSAHNELGKWGEEVARDYLLTRGYAIDGVNQRIGRVEIDFIARKDNRICFVEVKTRSTDIVDPVEAIDRTKRQRMVSAADMYMRGVDIALEPQFDLIFIIGGPDGYELEHIEDAFYPTL
ncbi:MAG: YraN family protein [Duncaniella sp.]|nr:YraN family protein [Duncaniella sp.]